MFFFSFEPKEENVTLTFILMLMGGASQGGQQPNAFAMFLPLIIIFFIMYFFMIRPQVKRQKQHQAMIQSLKKGDHVVTTGGIKGKIVNVKKDSFVVQIADNTRVEVLKTYILKRADQVE